MYYHVFTGKTCFPPQVALGGSFSSDGTTISVNSVTTLAVGNYLYSTFNNEVRLVTDVSADGLSYTIESSFTSNIPSDSPEAIQIADQSIDYYEVDIFNFGMASGYLNGQEFQYNLIANIVRREEPLIFTIDATGTRISILALL